MVEILLLMSLGMLLGYLLRRRRRVIRIAEKLIIWSIFLLLFFMGLSIGRDPLIISNLPSLGLTALLISFGGIGGSLLLALLTWKLIFSKKFRKHGDES